MLDEDLKKNSKENQNIDDSTNGSRDSELNESNSMTPETNVKNRDQEPNNSSSEDSPDSSDSTFTDGGSEEQMKDEGVASEAEPAQEEAMEEVVGLSAEMGKNIQGESATSEAEPTQEEVVKDLRERNLRLIAEMENLRRRTEKEIREARQFAVTSFARDILHVSDNLVRALQTVPEEMRENADSNLKSLLEGVEMTERELQNILSKHKISKIEPVDEKFDPHFHQAMFEVTDSDAANNTVVQVVQVGYKIGERVLRPAMVGVAKTLENMNQK